LHAKVLHGLDLVNRHRDDFISFRSRVKAIRLPAGIADHNVLVHQRYTQLIHGQGASDGIDGG
jgi:hypothetical protein